MPANIDQLFEMLDEEAIAQAVSIKHDTVREQYPLESNTVESFNDFKEEITLYYQWHFAHTMGNGNEDALMPPEMAYGYARQIIENYFQRRGELIPLEAAFRVAKTGTNGGLRFILSLLADSLKQSQEARYIDWCIDNAVAPTDYDGQAELMRSYLERYRDYIPNDIRLKSPEFLAAGSGYKELIKLHLNVIGRIRNNLAVY